MEKPWIGMESFYKERYLLLIKNFFDHICWRQNPQTGTFEKLNPFSLGAFEFAKLFIITNQNLVLTDFEAMMLDPVKWETSQLEAAALHHIKILKDSSVKIDNDISNLLLRFSKLHPWAHYQVRIYCGKLIMSGRHLPDALSKFVADFLSGDENPFPCRSKTGTVHRSRNRDFFVSMLMALLIDHYNVSPYGGLNMGKKKQKESKPRVIYNGPGIIYQAVRECECDLTLTIDIISNAWKKWRPFFDKIRT